MHSFYEPNAISHARLELNEQEATHAVKVLRLRDGDRITLFDGRGNSLDGDLEFQGKHVWVNTGPATFHPPSGMRLELAIAPTKNADRTEWVVEKAVEIGVQAISLIRCAHSERAHLRLDRLERLVIAAMKQSRKYYLTELHDIINLEDWLQGRESASMAIAHCNTEIPRIPLIQWTPATDNCAMLIGPEGDFSPEEIQRVLDCGGASVHLGHERLRTETAALVAVSTFAWKR
ncbi:MAG: RsmE family RNA methyltransferase [Flavobacteriales bacterium]